MENDLFAIIPQVVFIKKTRRKRFAFNFQVANITTETGNVMQFANRCNIFYELFGVKSQIHFFLLNEKMAQPNRIQLRHSLSG